MLIYKFLIKNNELPYLEPGESDLQKLSRTPVIDFSTS